jgi:hypothetical protein
VGGGVVGVCVWVVGGGGGGGYKPMDDGEITVLYISNTPTLQAGEERV